MSFFLDRHKSFYTLFLFFAFCVISSLQGQVTDIRIYRTPDGLSHNHVKGIEVTKDNRIAIQTNSGIAIFDGYDFIDLKLTERRLGIYAVAIDERNFLWALPNNAIPNDLIIYDLHKMQPVDKQQYFGAYFDELRKLNIFDIKNSTRNDYIKIYADTGTYLYGHNKLMQIEDKCTDDILIYDELNQVSCVDSVIRKCYKDESNPLVFLNRKITGDSLSVAFSKNEIIRFTIKESDISIDTISLEGDLVTGEITDLIYMDEHSHWISTTNGLFHITRPNFIYQHFLKNRSCRELYSINKDSILVAGYGGLGMIEIGKADSHMIDLSADYYAIEHMNNTTYLISTASKALFKLNLDVSPEIKKYELFQRKNHVTTDALKLNDSIIYLATNHGLYEYNYLNDHLSIEQFENGQIEEPVFSLQENKETGGVFICHSKGVYEINLHENTFESFPLLNKYDVTFIYKNADEPNIYWIGSRNNGLICWNKENNIERTWGVQDGLSNQTIHSIFEDNYDRLWLSTDYGINCFHKKTGEISHYLINEDDPVNEFNRNSAIQLDDSSIVFGSINGIIHFDPNKVRFQHNMVDPEILKIHYTTRGSSENNYIQIVEDLNQINLPRNHEKLVIHFVQDLTSKNSKFRFKIPELDDEWNYTTTGIVEYSRLEPKVYTLIYSMKTGIDDWTESKAMAIRIPQPLYLKSWFWLVMLAIAFLNYYYYSENRRKKLKQLNQIIEQQVKEGVIRLTLKNDQLEKMNETNEILFNILSHDLRAPLISMSSLASLIKDMVQVENNKLIKLGETLENRSKKMLEIIDYLLEWAKIQRLVGTKIKKYQSIDSILQVVEHELSEDLKEKHVTIKRCGDDDIFAEVDKISVIIIIRNILHNAIKFSKLHSRIEIHFDKQKKGLSIIDTAGGMPEHIIEKLMSINEKPKFTPAHKEVGLGIGLQISKYLIGSIKARLEIEVHEDVGTSMHLYFK